MLSPRLGDFKVTGKLSAAVSFRRSDCCCDSINPLPVSERDGARQIQQGKKKKTPGEENASYQLIGKTSSSCNGEQWGVVRLPCNEIAREPWVGFENAHSLQLRSTVVK